jgi:hypothetical protein
VAGSGRRKKWHGRNSCHSGVFLDLCGD